MTLICDSEGTHHALSVRSKGEKWGEKREEMREEEEMDGVGWPTLNWVSERSPPQSDIRTMYVRQWGPHCAEGFKAIYRAKHLSLTSAQFEHRQKYLTHRYTITTSITDVCEVFYISPLQLR